MQYKVNTYVVFVSLLTIPVRYVTKLICIALPTFVWPGYYWRKIVRQCCTVHVLLECVVLGWAVTTMGRVGRFQQIGPTSIHLWLGLDKFCMKRCQEIQSCVCSIIGSEIAILSAKFEVYTTIHCWVIAFLRMIRYVTLWPWPLTFWP